MFGRNLLLIAPFVGVAFSAFANSHSEICSRALLESHHQPVIEWDANNILRDPLFLLPNDEAGGLVTGDAPFDVPTVLRAFSLGIYPARERGNGKAEYYSPPLRGIALLNPKAVKQIPGFDQVFDAENREIDLDGISDDPFASISESDMKVMRRMERSGRYKVTFNQAFEDVIKNCRAMPRFEIDQYGEIKPANEWITPRFVDLYADLHHRPERHAVSAETWRDGKLIAGLYGVIVDGVFTGESMFYLKDPFENGPSPGSNAAKLAYYALLRRLIDNGHLFIDTEETLGLVKKWGGIKVPRRQFQKLLAHQQEMGLKF